MWKAAVVGHYPEMLLGRLTTVYVPAEIPCVNVTVHVTLTWLQRPGNTIANVLTIDLLPVNDPRT